jgi:acyl dehydratase
MSPGLRASEVAVGDAFEEVVVDDLSRTQIAMYAGASGDFQPLHSDDVYAKASGFRGVFAHGMLTMGLAGKALTHFCGAEHLIRYRARFLAQVWPGDTLTATATITALREEAGSPVADLALRAVNQDGIEVLNGTASARLAP